MEAWRRVFRDGLAPLLSTQSLEALRVALVTDDTRLIQGATTRPVAAPAGCRLKGACPISYCGWVGDELDTVGEVEEFFNRIRWAAELMMGEPDACSYFVSWVDSTPRQEMRRELLIEVQRTLAERLAVEDRKANGPELPAEELLTV